MSEELKPCPHCGSESCRVIGGPGTKGGPQFWAGCDHCSGRAWGDTQSEAIAAWNRRAPMTTPTPAGEEAMATTDLLVAGNPEPLGEALRRARLYIKGTKDDSGHKKWVMDGIDAALLSSPRVERARALEEAAKVVTDAIDSMRARQARRPGVEISALLLVADRIYQGIRSLSPTDKQARG